MKKALSVKKKRLASAAIAFIIIFSAVPSMSGCSVIEDVFGNDSYSTSTPSDGYYYYNNKYYYYRSSERQWYVYDDYYAAWEEVRPNSELRNHSDRYYYGSAYNDSYGFGSFSYDDNYYDGGYGGITEGYYYYNNKYYYYKQGQWYRYNESRSRWDTVTPSSELRNHPNDYYYGSSFDQGYDYDYDYDYDY